MTKQKSQTRFVVPFEGELRRLFSIREGSTGDLLITTHLRGIRNVTERYELAGIKELRDIIHVSPRSETNTVHGVVVHEDGSSEHRHLVTHAIRNRSFQPLYTRTVIHPRDLETLSLPSKGTVVRLPPHNPERCTLHYSIWFSAPQDLPLLPLEAPYTRLTIPYREFGIMVAMAYSATPSSSVGLISYSTTTTVEKRTPEHAALGLSVGPTSGAPPAAVVGYVVRDFNDIVRKAAIRGYKPDRGPLVPQRVQGWRGNPEF